MKKLIFASLLFNVACLGPVEPDVGGENQGASCVNADSDPAVNVSFQNDIVPTIFAIGAGGCLQCHAPDAPTPIGFEIGGLDISTHDLLLGGGITGGSDNIIPGDPCGSIFFQKTEPGPPFGARMPLDGPPFLSAEDSQLLHDWIFEGAQNN